MENLIQSKNNTQNVIEQIWNEYKVGQSKDLSTNLGLGSCMHSTENKLKLIKQLGVAHDAVLSLNMVQDIAKKCLSLES